MRTNIDIDDALMAEAMKAGPYSTKKDAVEAGLRLLARQVAYREILKWEGKLKWEGDESIDWVAANRADAEAAVGSKVQQPPAPYRVSQAPPVSRASAKPKATARAAPSGPQAKTRRAGR